MPFIWRSLWQEFPLFTLSVLQSLPFHVVCASGGTFPKLSQHVALNATKKETICMCRETSHLLYVFLPTRGAGFNTITNSSTCHHKCGATLMEPPGLLRYLPTVHWHANVLICRCSLSNFHVVQQLFIYKGKSDPMRMYMDGTHYKTRR